MQFIIQQLFTAAFFFATLIGLSHDAFANEGANASLSVRGLSTAKKLEKAALTFNALATNRSELESLNERHKLNRLKIFEGFDSSGDISFLEDIRVYKAFAQEHNLSHDLELAIFFEEFSEVYNPYGKESLRNLDSALIFLERYRGSGNWLISHSATILSAVLEGYTRDFSTAVSLASDSLSIVPDDGSFDASIANLYSYTVDSFLYGSLKNTDLFLFAVDRLIELSAEIQYPIQSIELLNNLIYSMREIDDRKLTSELVNILLRVGENEKAKTPGLVEMRASKELIRIGAYEKALPLAQRGQSKAKNLNIWEYLTLAEAQSLAASGQSEAAEAALQVFFQHKVENGSHSGFDNSEVSKAKALIAMANGDADETFKMMDRYAELSIQRLLRSNNSDTSNLLANLENDKARQAEREAAREEMYRLEQDALTQRVNATQRGLALMVMLALAAIFTATFMTYRSRTSLKLAQSAEAALAGEQAKSEFLAVISHELRTPLNGIIGIADLLSRTAPTEDLRQKISIINDSGQDLLNLVEQILDMSRIDAEEMQIFPETTNIRDIVSTVDMLWRPTIEEKGVIFTSFVDPSVPQLLKLDPMRVKQCVNNLLSNASKFTHEGRIHMHITALPTEGDITTELNIIVADTGMGIRQDVQSNLFRPFVQANSSITRQYGGSGLGLAISRSLARMMGGDMTVVSREGAGSEFTLTVVVEEIEDVEVLNTMDELFSQFDEDAQTIRSTLQPAAHAELVQDNLMLLSAKRGTSPDGHHITDFDDLSGVRVLIVEDVISNQDVIKIFLEPQGCEIMCTNNGVEALEAVKAQSFDVILMDIRMPEMDGIEATRLIRSEASQNATVPIIALTADATAETNAQCMAAGANIFLTKPIIATELYDSIRFVRRQAQNRIDLKQASEQIAKNPIQISA